MTAQDILVVSSSPPKPFTTYSISSSPSIPSPSHSLTRKVPNLRTEDRPAFTPQNAIASFKSASNPLKLDILQGVNAVHSLKCGQENDELLQAKRMKRSLKAKPLKGSADMGHEAPDVAVTKRTRKIAAEQHDRTLHGTETKSLQTSKGHQEFAKVDAVKRKAPRKLRAKQIETGDDKGQEKAMHKPRTKQACAGKQRKLPNNRVIKAMSSTEKDLAKKPRLEDTATADLCTDSLDYGLAEAVKRRASWTPPPPDLNTELSTTSIPEDSLAGKLASVCLRPSDEKGNGFQDLLGNFGFSKVERSIADRSALEGGGTRKRKLIELVTANVFASTTGASKAKAPRKKPRTITELATSAYAREEQQSSKPARLLQYFSLDTTERTTERDSSKAFKVPPSRSSSHVKCRKRTASGTTLLSPESALKQVGYQDFVFGTSSQLAREESPSFLRAIHAAMQASNEVDNKDPFAPAQVQFGVQSNSSTSLKGNLWSAAARDGNGHVLNVEVVDLVDSPAVARQFQTATLLQDDSLEPHKEDKQPQRDIEKLVETTADATHIENPQKIGPVETAIRLDLLSSPSSPVKSSTIYVKSSSQVDAASVKLASNAKETKRAKPSRSKVLEKPDFSAYTMAQLQREVASYHFKPVKSRDQMIALLDKCWLAKYQRLALGSLAANMPTSSRDKTAKPVIATQPSSQLQTTSLKRPRGRPRKDNSASPSPKRKTKTASIANALSRARKVQKKAEPLDEISDSDTPKAPSPPRRHPSQVGTPPLPLQFSSSASTDGRELSPASSQARISKHITKAVTMAPRSTDSLNPSWYEKMLLYDPIILEDLTIWLNTGALEKAGWDGEVDPKEVKKWCESKSICCLWKENLRGGSRSRY